MSSIRILLILFLGMESLGAFSSTQLRSLQENFYQQVLLDNLYKKRFKTFIARNCDPNDVSCQDQLVRKLKADIPVADDATLQVMVQKRQETLYIAPSYWQRLESYLIKQPLDLRHTQFVTFIDLKKQWIILLLWRNLDRTFYLVGNDLISSGNMEREVTVQNGEDHYLKTPTGIFTIQSGWRSVGKFKHNGATLPYGQKYRFVYYFGRQKSIRYQTLDKYGDKMLDPARWEVIEDELDFALHAHKSYTPFGQPYSHGCVRMTNELNRFMDNFWVLHDKVLNGDKWISVSADPPKDPKDHRLAGKYLVIADEI